MDALISGMINRLPYSLGSIPLLYLRLLSCFWFDSLCVVTSCTIFFLLYTLSRREISLSNNWRPIDIIIKSNSNVSI
jgi:hypothetical protein